MILLYFSFFYYQVSRRSGLYDHWKYTSWISLFERKLQTLLHTILETDGSNFLISWFAQNNLLLFFLCIRQSRRSHSSFRMLMIHMLFRITGQLQHPGNISPALPTHRVGMATTAGPLSPVAYKYFVEYV